MTRRSPYVIALSAEDRAVLEQRARAYTGRITGGAGFGAGFGAPAGVVGGSGVLVDAAVVVGTEPRHVSPSITTPSATECPVNPTACSLVPVLLHKPVPVVAITRSHSQSFNDSGSSHRDPKGH